MNRRRWLGVLLVALAAAGCGKKGPPLPPLVRIPQAPTELVVARRGSSAAVSVKVPTSNIDGASPADVAHVDVYAYNGPATASSDIIVRSGTRVGSVKVNEPIDPDASQEEADAARAAQPKDAVDQGAVAAVTDSFTLPETVAVDAARAYVAVGVSKRGRRGPASAKVLVPLAPSPPAPAAPRVTYDEANVAIDWTATAPAVPPDAYYVYRVDGQEKNLTPTGTPNTSILEPGVVWAERRCYVLRTMTKADDLPLQSEASPEVCVTLTDTFPPPPPTGLQTIAAEGAVNLIWDPSPAPDLAGYLVLRAIPPQTTPEPLFTTPTPDVTYRDTVPSGARVIYSVLAVDKAGNRSAASAVVEETAR